MSNADVTETNNSVNLTTEISSVTVEQTSNPIEISQTTETIEVIQQAQPTVVVEATGQPGPQGDAGSLEKDRFTLTTQQIDTDKQVSLTSTPTDNEAVIVMIAGGAPVVQDDDYTVSGTTLSWDGLDLDGILEAGDVMEVHYSIS